MPTSRVKITVVGSLNVDLVATVAHLPHPGETIGTRGFAVCRGGKGANQALAAARQHAQVSLIGCVGRDEAGRDYRAFLAREGLGISGLFVLERERTGTAIIAVDAAGENQIILVPGANARLTATMVRKQARFIRGAAALLLQFETPPDSVVEACRIAAAAGVRIVLNPSPWRENFPWGVVPISTVVVNETEAADLFKIAPAHFGEKRAAMLAQMQRARLGEVVITRGAKSTLCLHAGVLAEIPVMRVEPLDTVGAGDTFAGTLAVHLAEGNPLERAIQFANCAAALATLKLGAQGSTPTRRATDRATARLFPNVNSSILTRS